MFSAALVDWQKADNSGADTPLVLFLEEGGGVRQFGGIVAGHRQAGRPASFFFQFIEN